MSAFSHFLDALLGRKDADLNTSSLLGVVIQHGHDYAFLNDGATISSAAPIILNTDDVTEHVIYQIEHILEQRDIIPEHIYLVPHEISFRPLVDLSLHLAIVTVSEEEFIRVKVADFTSVSAAQVSMHREGNVFFDLLSRHQDSAPAVP